MHPEIWSVSTVEVCVLKVFFIDLEVVVVLVDSWARGLNCNVRVSTVDIIVEGWGASRPRGLVGTISVLIIGVDDGGETCGGARGNTEIIEQVAVSTAGGTGLAYRTEMN
jgi:hypothetical protein